MTRRWSVMRMPVAAQRASIPVALSAGVDFSAAMGFAFAYQRKFARSTSSGLAQGSKQFGEELMRQSNHVEIRSDVTRILIVADRTPLLLVPSGGGHDKSRRIRTAFNSSPFC